MMKEIGSGLEKLDETGTGLVSVGDTIEAG